MEWSSTKFIILQARKTAALAVMFTAIILIPSEGQINRKAVVSRHNPVITNQNLQSPLSIGNGNFAFTVDFTGLQTFPEHYEKTVPLGTLSHWGWHSFPNTNNWTLDNYELTGYDFHDRKIFYPDIPGNRMTAHAEYLRNNPHRLHLGRIGLYHGEGRKILTLQNITNIYQTLDLWKGILFSKFDLNETTVEVETFCHPERDAVCMRVRSPLVNQKKLGIIIGFPYGTPLFCTADWSNPDKHQTIYNYIDKRKIIFRRNLDNDFYAVILETCPDITILNVNRHEFAIFATQETDAIEVVCEFSPVLINKKLPAYSIAKNDTINYWYNFWSSGGAIDLSESKDPRWQELERRIVLSQYLTAIQCAGIYPPAESGLTFNSWSGKFHLEMHWWHAAHFALWERTDLLERSLGWYESILQQSSKTARFQGFEGARFPKMTSPSGVESPSPVGPFLIWQQPHPIYLSELVFRNKPTKETLHRYYKIVEAAADFMASFPWLDKTNNRFILGPPLQCAQERFPKQSTFNPAFELTYWRWGLETAQKWRARLGLKPVEKWQRVLNRLSTPAITNNLYLFCESAPDSYTNPRYKTDHPAVLAAFGFLPGPGIDKEIMKNTFRWIWENWNWKETWGWDYPLIAMTAARLGESEKAIDAILMDTPKNKFNAAGHNYQRPGLSVYLPANGGLLSAIAMMTAGWDGCPTNSAPGFPSNGMWKVKYENLRPLP